MIVRSGRDIFKPGDVLPRPQGPVMIVGVRRRLSDQVEYDAVKVPEKGPRWYHKALAWLGR